VANAPVADEANGNDVVVVDNPEKRRYEARLGDRVVGFTDYRPARGRLIFIHTEVDPAFEGRGIGTRIASGALTDVRARGLKATIHCPFLTTYLQRHREFDDIVVEVRPGG
jgi:hypothetical protein